MLQSVGHAAAGGSPGCAAGRARCHVGELHAALQVFQPHCRPLHAQDGHPALTPSLLCPLPAQIHQPHPPLTNPTHPLIFIFLQDLHLLHHHRHPAHRHQHPALPARLLGVAPPPGHPPGHRGHPLPVSRAGPLDFDYILAPSSARPPFPPASHPFIARPPTPPHPSPFPGWRPPPCSSPLPPPPPRCAGA